VLAWAACAAGIAAGVLGCVLLASTRRPSTAAAFGAKRTFYSAEQWATLVERAASDGLATVRRLAAGVAPSEVTDVQVSLHEISERLLALQACVPSRFANDDELRAWLRIAADGASAEAARLSGVTTMRTDRKAFLAALRTLRDVPDALEVKTSPREAPAATGDVAPTFTIA
jgi:hypothetical protein